MAEVDRGVCAAGRPGQPGRNTIGGGGWRRRTSLWSAASRSRRRPACISGSRLQRANHPSAADPIRFRDSPLFGAPVSMLNLMLGSGSARSALTPAFQIGGPRTLQLQLRRLCVPPALVQMLRRGSALTGANCNFEPSFLTDRRSSDLVRFRSPCLGLARERFCFTVVGTAPFRPVALGGNVNCNANYPTPAVSIFTASRPAPAHRRTAVSSTRPVAGPGDPGPAVGRGS